MKQFSVFEKWLWCVSVVLIAAFFLIFDRENPLSPVASVIGITSLIFCAKGKPLGQALMIVFSILYGIISFAFAYYGEMMTYLGMSLPMAVLALVSWMRNPDKDDPSHVAVGKLYRWEPPFIGIAAVLVTVGFYFILREFGTANLIPSTFSVTTSFVAAYLTFRRNPYYAVAYATNDVVLLVLWTLAAFEDISYLSVLICFAVFLVGDLYGFVCWLKRAKAQKTVET